MNVVAHNLMAMNTSRQYRTNVRGRNKTSERLASGYKINRAADDAAGLSISEKMRHLIRNIDMATKNTEDAISFCQTADGAMEELHEITKRMRELVVQGANDVNDTLDRQAIQDELDELSEEVSYVVNNTKFNGIKVFGKNRLMQVYDGNQTTATTTPTSSQIVEVEGTNYGLGEILGKDHISNETRMSDRITLDSFSGWKSTGEYPTRYGTAVEANYASKLGLSNLTYNSVKSLNPAESSIDNGYVKGKTLLGYVTDAAGDKTYYQCSYYEDLKGNLQLGYARIDGVYISFRTNGGGNGVAAWAGSSHNASWLDFSEVGTRYRMQDLYNQGFNVTCGHCSRHYSIIFTDGQDGATYSTAGDGTRYSYSGGGITDGNDKLLKIDISGYTSGSDIVKGIMSAADDTFLSEHLTEYAYNISNPNRIYIYDNCSSGAGGFEPIARHIDGTVASDTKVSFTGVDNITYTYDDSDLWIQSGGVSGQGLMMLKPWITEGGLGLNSVSVASHEIASDGLGVCDRALQLVSQERSRVGAYMNRFEHTIENNNTSSENLTKAESLIRDTDMATEMTEYSKHNILLQAAQSMLSQANSASNGILQLIQ